MSRAASRTGKKKTTPSKDAPAKKRGEGQRVSTHSLNAHFEI